jgi:hypothetical protein
VDIAVRVALSFLELHLFSVPCGVKSPRGLVIVNVLLAALSQIKWLGAWKGIEGNSVRRNSLRRTVRSRRTGGVKVKLHTSYKWHHIADEA